MTQERRTPMRCRYPPLSRFRLRLQDSSPHLLAVRGTPLGYEQPLENLRWNDVLPGLSHD